MAEGRGKAQAIPYAERARRPWRIAFFPGMMALLRESLAEVAYGDLVWCQPENSFRPMARFLRAWLPVDESAITGESAAGHPLKLEAIGGRHGRNSRSFRSH